MRINEFIEYMEKNVNGTMKSEQVLALVQKQLDVKKYISIKKKKNLVDKIIEKCIYFENGTFRIDAIDSYIYFTMLTIDTYTNLEIDSAEECFDMLSEAGLMKIVISALGQEYNDVQTLLNMKRNEILENNSLEMQLGKLFDGILDKVGDLNNTLIDLLNGLNIDKNSVMKIAQMFLQQ